MKENKYTYEDILNKNDLNILEFMHIGPATGPFWTRSTIENNSNIEKEITLYNPLAGINKIDVYILKDNKLTKIVYLGDLRAQKLRDSISTYSSFRFKNKTK